MYLFNQFIMNIEQLLNKINDHGQYQDDMSHHSVRTIDNWTIVLGEIFGTATQKIGKGKYTHYFTQILIEDDDFWFVYNGSEFSNKWLDDFIEVLTNTKKELK